MYKLTFEDKPEANTYVKWARGKGYLVEGPYRERLSKNVKKFDLNGKRKKFSFVVLRKRGAGKEGGDVSLAVLDETKRKKGKQSGGIPQPQLNPESTQRADPLPTRPMSKRWMGDRGAMPGEPSLFLDVKGDDFDTAKAAIIERVDKQGNAVYELVDSSGKGKGFFQTEEDAGKYAESIYSELKKRGSPKGSGKKISSKLQPLAAEAAKYDKFDDFEKAFSHEIRHGRYYHVTDNPNFALDPSTGPKDASSMAGKPVPAKGKLMITSDLDNWAAEYKGKRQYVAIIDMSEVPKEKYWQVNRGFGNEFWVDDPSKAKVIKVVPMSQAKVDSRLHHKALPSSKEKLKDFYEKAKPAKAEIPIQPEIKRTVTGGETKAEMPVKWTQEWQEKQVLSEIEQYKQANPSRALLYHGRGRLERKRLTGGYLTTNIDEAIEYAMAAVRTGEPGEAFVYVVDRAQANVGRSHVPNLPENVELLKPVRYVKRFDVMKDYESKVKPRKEQKAQKPTKSKVETSIQPEIKKVMTGAESKPTKESIKQAIKEKKRVPLKVLREHRDVVKEEIKERKRAKADKEREHEYRERAEKADREEAKYWEETKLTAEQQSRDEEVEALKAEAEAYEKSEVVKGAAA